MGRHEIDLDLGTDDPNHVTDHDRALDQEHEHTQEIRMIMLGVSSQNHDRNQLIEAQIEDRVKNVIEPDLDLDRGRAIYEDTHLMMIQNLDLEKKRKRNIK